MALCSSAPPVVFGSLVIVFPLALVAATCYLSTESSPRRLIAPHHKAGFVFSFQLVKQLQQSGSARCRSSFQTGLATSASSGAGFRARERRTENRWWSMLSVILSTPWSPALSTTAAALSAPASAARTVQNDFLGHSGAPPRRRLSRSVSRAVRPAKAGGAHAVVLQLFEASQRHAGAVGRDGPSSRLRHGGDGRRVRDDEAASALNDVCLPRVV